MADRSIYLVQKRYLITLSTLVVLLCLSGCGAQPVLSAPFTGAARVTRQWVEACQKGDTNRAAGYWSKGDPDLAQTESVFLSELHRATRFEIIGIEDWSSLISSGKLLVVIRRPDGKQGALVINLANSESGPVVTRVDYVSSSDGFRYSGSSYGRVERQSSSFDLRFWY